MDVVFRPSGVRYSLGYDRSTLTRQDAPGAGTFWNTKGRSEDGCEKS